MTDLATTGLVIEITGLTEIFESLDPPPAPDVPEEERTFSEFTDYETAEFYLDLARHYADQNHVSNARIYLRCVPGLLRKLQATV